MFMGTMIGQSLLGSHRRNANAEWAVAFDAALLS